jgi:hypothetical protein
MVFPRELFRSFFWLKCLYTSHICKLSLSLELNTTITFVEAYKQIPDRVRFSTFLPISVFYVQMSPLGYTFSGALAKLRKATTTFVMAVYTSVRPLAWNNQGRPLRIFMKFDVWEFFEKSANKIQVSLKSDKNNGFVTWRTINILK